MEVCQRELWRDFPGEVVTDSYRCFIHCLHDRDALFKGSATSSANASLHSVFVICSSAIGPSG